MLEYFVIVTPGIIHITSMLNHISAEILEPLSPEM